MGRSPFMTERMTMTPNPGSSKLKLISAAILLLGGIGFLYSQYLSNSAAGLADPPRSERLHVRGAAPSPAMGGRPGPPSPEDRARFRAEMEKDLALTPKQAAQIAALDKKYDGREGDFRERREEMENILTTEQRDKMRGAMMSRMKAHMEERLKVLPESEKQAFMKKLEERMKNGPPGGFGHRPGGPPPPDGGPRP
ncbi:hypothetical protein IT570_01625 [Candidatus Sumerlaeota bacterium]|nr:hypothetical protein [Candidatus Sumerlaeota bacterium]